MCVGHILGACTNGVCFILNPEPPRCLYLESGTFKKIDLERFFKVYLEIYVGLRLSKSKFRQFQCPIHAACGFHYSNELTIIVSTIKNYEIA